MTRYTGNREKTTHKHTKKTKSLKKREDGTREKKRHCYKETDPGVEREKREIPSRAGDRENGGA